MRPVCKIVELYLPLSEVSRDLYDAFSSRRGGPMSKFAADNPTEHPEDPEPRSDRVTEGLAALNTPIVITDKKPPGGAR